MIKKCVYLLALLLPALTAAVTYTYDTAGRLTKVDYGNGNALIYAYDNAGSLLSRTLQTPAQLSIAKSHTGNFTQGQNGATYSLVVSNAAGTAATSGTVTVTETVPTGLTLVSMAGTGWTCPSGGTTCTRNDPLNGGASYQAITATVNVSPSAPAQVSNQVSVSGGGGSGGLASDLTTIVPLATGITIQTVPSGLQFTIDGGAPQTAPQTLPLSQGSHTVAVATTQTGAAGTRNVFSSWSDNGAASHSITVGSSSAIYTATFQTQYQLTITASPAIGGSVTPATGTYFNASAAAPITATSNSGYAFTGWTGSVAAPIGISTTITMTGPQTVTANFVSLQGIPFFNGSVAGGFGTLYLQFPNGTPFGYYGFTATDWIYHADLGYEYIVPANDVSNSVYIWDLTTGHWWFTSPSLFPYIYDFNLKAWLYYFPNTNVSGHYTTGPRYFANLTTNAIFTM